MSKAMDDLRNVTDKFAAAMKETGAERSRLLDDAYASAGALIEDNDLLDDSVMKANQQELIHTIEL
jgi:hypothetical protein